MDYTNEELYAMTEGDALAATAKMLDHQDNYDGPCNCMECIIEADHVEY